MLRNTALLKLLAPLTARRRGAPPPEHPRLRDGARAGKAEGVTWAWPAWARIPAWRLGRFRSNVTSRGQPGTQGAQPAAACRGAVHACVCTAEPPAPGLEAYVRAPDRPPVRLRTGGGGRHPPLRRTPAVLACTSPVWSRCGSPRGTNMHEQLHSARWMRPLQCHRLPAALGGAGSAGRSTGLARPPTGPACCPPACSWPRSMACPLAPTRAPMGTSTPASGTQLRLRGQRTQVPAGGGRWACGGSLAAVGHNCCTAAWSWFRLQQAVTLCTPIDS